MDDILNPNNYPTYQIGDQVTIRQWDDMKSEFGLNKYDDIAIPKIFSKAMKRFCGQTFSIKEVRRKPSPNFDTYILEENEYYFSSPMFEQSKPAQFIPAPTLTLDDLLQGATS